MTDGGAHIAFRVEGPRATITLDNEAKHNRVGSPEIQKLIDLLDRIAGDDRVRVLVLTGAGRRTFCAGFNLKEMQAADPDDMARVPWPAMLDRLRALPVPTVAALNGSCFGGGVHLALACDFRIGVTGMELHIPAARIGLVYQPSGIKRMTDLLGAGFAMRALIAGERFSADSLLDIGFLDRLVAPSALAETVEVLADDIGSMAPLAVRAMKTIINSASDGSYSADAAARLQQASLGSDDLAEGLKALAEKRTPVFRGS